MSSKALRNEHGYAIEIEAAELRFVSTHRSSVGLFSLIAGGLALILLVNGGVQMAMTNAVAGLVLGGLGALFGTVAVLVWKRRRPPTTQTLTLANGALRVGETMVAPATDLKPVVQIDWTDGMGGFRFARVVSLRWPRGKLPIYKSYDKGEIAEVQRHLADHGIR